MFYSSVFSKKMFIRLKIPFNKKLLSNYNNSVTNVLTFIYIQILCRSGWYKNKLSVFRITTSKVSHNKKINNVFVLKDRYNKIKVNR